jgi:hypothetical protein
MRATLAPLNLDIQMMYGNRFANVMQTLRLFVYNAKQQHGGCLKSMFRFQSYGAK